MNERALRQKQNQHTAYGECGLDKIVRFIKEIDYSYTSRDVANITGLNIKLVSWALIKIESDGYIFITGKSSTRGSGYLFRKVTDSHSPIDVDKYFTAFCFNHPTKGNNA